MDFRHFRTQDSDFQRSFSPTRCDVEDVEVAQVTVTKDKLRI